VADLALSRPPRRRHAAPTAAIDSLHPVADAPAVSSQGPITVNPAHWLDDGLIPAEPPRLRAMALRVAQAIEAGGPLARGLSRETLIPCTEHSDGAACCGLMVALKQRDDAILLFCPVCINDEYLIYEWEDTLWANGLQRSPEWVRVRHGKQTRHDLGDHIDGVPGTRDARMTKQEGRGRGCDPVLPVPAAPWFMWGRPCDGARARRCGWWCSDDAHDRGERRPSLCGRGRRTIHRSLNLWSRSSIVSHTSPPSA